MHLTNDDYCVIGSCPLFVGIPSKKIKLLFAEKGQTKNYEKGQTVYTPTFFEKQIGIVLSGTLEIFSPTSQNDVLLNTMNKGFIVGVAALFGNSKTYVSTVVAKETSKLLHFNQQEVENMMLENFQFSKNYVFFLSDRIEFLNKKIQTFTAPTAEEKLMHFLTLYQDRNGLVRLPKTKLASMLGLGRASLYRALDDLMLKGFIQKEGQSIKVLK